MKRRYVPLILGISFCAGGLHASVIYKLISNRDFPGPTDVQQIQSGTLTSTTSDSLHVFYSSNPGSPTTNTYDGTAAISTGPFALVTHNAVTIGSTTTTVSNFLSAVSAGIDETGVTITGGSGTGHFLPTFHIFGTETDTSPDTDVGPSICAGNNVCDAAGIPGNPGIPRAFGSLATLANIDGFYTPPMDSTTSFTFGTPFEFFFFYGGFIDNFFGTPGGSVTSDLTLELVGYQIVDNAGNAIPGAQIHSQFIDAVSTPEPGTSAMAITALAILGLVAARKKPAALRRMALTFAAVALAGSITARAQSIPIANPSFELPQIPAGTVKFTTIPGWTSSNGTVAGVANLPATEFLPPTDGTQIGFIKGELAVSQVTGALVTPNTRYILSVDCFGLNVPTGVPTHAQIYLSAGGADLAFSANIDFSAGNPHTITVDAIPGGNTQGNIPFDSLFGKPIQIVLSTEDGIFGFDNVRLQAIPLLPKINQVFFPAGIPQHEIARQSSICAFSPTPCDMTLEFLDLHGVLLSQSHLTLRPGETGFLDLPSTAQGREPMEVIPRWWLNQGSAEFSLEVFDDANLRTRFFANWGDGSVSKTGNLDSGPVSMSRSDTGRLKVYCDGSVRVEGTFQFAPCQAVLTFLDVNGTLLKQSRQTLAPGTAAFLDISFEETRSTDRRAVIIPSLTVTGGPAVGGFALLDSATGITITQSYPAATQSAGQ